MQHVITRTQGLEIERQKVGVNIVYVVIVILQLHHSNKASSLISLKSEAEVVAKYRRYLICL